MLLFQPQGPSWHLMGLSASSMFQISLLLTISHAVGKKSGLQSAKSLREENVRTKRLEDQRYAAMEKTLSGKGATTIYRDKSGKKIDLDEEKRKRDEIERKKAEENIKYDQWKKG